MSDVIEAKKDPLEHAKDTIDQVGFGSAAAVIQAVSTYALAYAVIALVERLDGLTADISNTDAPKHAIRTFDFGEGGYE